MHGDLEQKLRYEQEHENPYRDHLQIKVTQMGEDWARVEMPWSREITNRWGNHHGGAIASLVDSAMSAAIVAKLPPDAELGATIELSMRFVAPASGDLYGIGRVIRMGGRITFAEAQIYDETDTLITTAQGTFQILRQKKPAS